MFGEIVYEHFQESDAQQVAELLNRNRFHTARNKHMTAEDYLFTQRSRGVYFQIVAKKNGKVIAMAGAYPSSDQHVAKKGQIFVGTFLVDMQYRLTYSVIMGLYDGLMKGMANRDFKEILAGVRPENEGSYNLMLKCGFVLLDEEPNDFGRIGLHCFSPALGKFVGADVEVSDNTFFSVLPLVNKKEARKVKAKPRINDRYIECDYMLDGNQVVLLFDIVNYKIDGAADPDSLRLYPDFGTQGRYIAENLSNTDSFMIPIELVMTPESGRDNISYAITLEPGQTEAIECSEDVSELKFAHSDKWFRLYPNLFEDVEVPKEPVKLNCGKLSAVLYPSTGFVNITDGEKELVTLVWPCAVYPYMEGVNTPRIKDLRVEQQDNGVVITEETDEYLLTRKCLLSEDKMDVITTLKCKTETLNARPISQVYARKGVQGYTLKSGEKKMDFGASAIKHQGFEFSDYAYWVTEPGLFDDFPIESVSLKYGPSTVEVVIDKKCEPIIHAPIFTHTLDFDMDKVLEEQVIEQIEVYYRTEEV